MRQIRRNLAVIVAAVAVVTSTSLPASGESRSGSPAATAVRHGRYGPDSAHRFTLFSSAARRGDTGRPPLALFIHGGAWALGDRSDATGVAAVSDLIANGWAVASIGYRLTPTDRHPAQIRDVRRAVRHLRDHSAELGVDARTIMLVGFSAGGHLALLGATTLKAVDGAIAIAPVTDVRAIAADLPEEVSMLLGCPLTRPLCDDAALDALEPARALDRRDPPMYVLSGRADALTTVEDQIRPFVRAARAVLPRGHVWLDVVDGVGHGGIVGHTRRTVEFATMVRRLASDEGR